MRTGDIIGIDFGTSTLKLAHIGWEGKKRLIRALSCRSLAGLNDDDIAQAVLVGLRAIGAKDPRVVLFVPAQIVVTKNIEIPSTDPREIREIVNLQAGRHTPHAREEVIVDYIALGTLRQHYTKVLLLIVTSGAVKRQFAILEKAGIRIDRAVLAHEGIAAFASRYLGADSVAPTAMLTVDDGSSDFSVIARGKVLFMRSIPLGADALAAEGQKARDKLTDEVKKSLEAYQAEGVEAQPALVLVTGAEAGLEGFDTALFGAAQLPVRGCRYGGVFPCSARAREAYAQNPHASFLTVIAGLAAFNECRTDLIPEEIKLRRALARRGRQLIQTAIAVVGILAVLFATMVSTVYFGQQRLAALREYYAPQRKQAAVLEETLRRNRMVRSYVAGRGASVAVLAELHAVTPLTVELTYIKFEQEGPLVLRGTAESMTAAFAFGDTLSKSRHFQDVKTKYARKRQEGKREVADFEINCAVRTEAKR